ncbi:AAA-ATPase At2g18193-like [Hevea brasiliensis]|uniref:AAA-ATPase At2g18193-like n=1 Tax=Hevea brasiliensis TaxID=3981 RepID=UPI0025D795FA|nr:AAA-ATPase At2g18193-like [Hevea brasiliensis]
MPTSVMEYARVIPSVSSLLPLYASFSTSLMLLRNAYHELVPEKLESFLTSKLENYFRRTRSKPSYDTFVIDDSWEGQHRNKLIDISIFYLSTKIGHKNKTIKIGKFKGRKGIMAGLVNGEEIVDIYEGIEITWYFDCRKDEDGGDEYFELSFEDKYREKVFNEYLDHVIRTYKAMTKEKRVLRIYSRDCNGWDWIEFQHAATFDTLAMDYELKRAITDDLDRFLARKDYYKKICRAWKRGYLLYGPPGTGKSSLIAAMANYLNYNVYNLELANISSESDLKSAMLHAGRKSIIVIEDIDCNSGVHDRSKSDNSESDNSNNVRFTLSALLNCIDGLWSSCAEERIIAFTTNHKEVLDPALLRPGRMDMHIHMSYCTTEGFRVLVSNYLDIKDHPLFEEIDGLIRSMEVTPASLAEELMKSDVADVALGEVLNFLKQKRMEKDKIDEEKLC